VGVKRGTYEYVDGSLRTRKIPLTDREQCTISNAVTARPVMVTGSNLNNQLAEYD